MKKIVPLSCVVFITLLLVISTRFIFFMGFVKSQKADFRKQLLHLPATNTQTLRIQAHALFKNGNGLEWKEHNKELVIQGQYYEVLSVKKLNTDYLVTIIEDKAENELFTSYFSVNEEAKHGLKDITLALLGLNFILHQATLLPALLLKCLVHYLPVKIILYPVFSNALIKPPMVN